ncbi:hypothetical protein M406DRAFT_248498 [Cryphonectria parasitica EP155]|uniref:Trichothecene 3-O-acetyltransferase-like N-terminal domain-containing protein n=1 Tax=Cryphonectria parasitica (strain ATCC 38755 / EP155) TaxID=660469 RepID=A0A9P4YAQ8_CRYP1|nr:uncharacterized protein M406DRAFT_248498 [Cryphonectria parasitica EP155]KAF3769422.1 hypothetical protein M406DRAFT_248498 [Cryphonectria parasitica EP155]
MSVSENEICVALTPFDHCVPRAYYLGAAYLPLKAGVEPLQAFELLREGLHRTFVQLPWLNGKVRLQSSETPGWRPGQLELGYAPAVADEPRAPQLKFKELETDLDYESVRELGFPLDSFRDAELAPTAFFADPVTEPNVFVGQANFLPGGCILVSAIHHVASDQGAFFRVLRLWGEHCAALQTHTSSATPAPFPAGSDSRDILHEIWARECPVSSVEEVDPETWRLVGLLPTDVTQSNDALSSQPPSRPQPPKRLLKAGVFYLSPARLAALRETIAKDLGVASGISANDAVSALIWQCFMRARVAARRPRDDDKAEDKEQRLNMVFDGRANYSSALPQTYLGNLTFNVQSSLPTEALIGRESSLGTVAATIRRNAGWIDSTNLLNLYNLLDHLPSYTELMRLKLMRFATIDGNNMTISSLINVSMDTLCFGDGLVFGNRGYVEATRLLFEGNNSFTRLCVVLPRSRNGGVEFLANLYDEEYEALLSDSEFAKYVLCLCWPE